MHTILVTGSAGAIGKPLCQALTSAGYNVRGFDTRATGNERGDITHAATLAKAMHAIDGVIHLAAVSRVRDAQFSPDGVHSVNVKGTEDVVAAALRSPTKPWLLFTSSREVYGTVSANAPATESSPLAPVNFYGSTKHGAEWAVDEGRPNGLRALTLRLSNIYGSPSDIEERVIPTFVRLAQKGSPLRVDGANRALDFLHIDDLLSSFLLAIEALNRGVQLPPVLNICAGRSVTLQTLAQEVVEAAASKSRIFIEPANKYDVGSFYGSQALVTATLGWTPTITLEAGIRGLLAPTKHENKFAAPTEATP